MVKSFQDPNKAHWRAKLVDFIRQHYTPAQLESAIYVCFPGKEMFEISEVTDKLGIRRENVYGIERDALEYRALCEGNRQIGTPINTFFGTEVAFLKETQIRANVISLDYCGPWSREKHDLISTIFERPVIVDQNGIIAINLLAQRENEDNKEFIEGQVYSHRFAQHISNMFYTGERFVDVNRPELSTLTNPDEIIHQPLAFRDEVVIRTIIFQGVRRGCLDREHRLFTYFQNTKRIIEGMRNELQKEHDAEKDEEKRGYLRHLIDDPLANIITQSMLEYAVGKSLPEIMIPPREQALSALLPSEFFDHIKETLSARLRPKASYAGITFFYYLLAAHVRSFFATRNERYRYMSTAKQAMNSEFVRFERPNIYLSERDLARVYETLVIPFLQSDTAAKETICRIFKDASGSRRLYNQLVDRVTQKPLRRALRDIGVRGTHEKLLRSMEPYMKYSRQAIECKSTPRYLLAEGLETLIDTVTDVSAIHEHPAKSASSHNPHVSLDPHIKRRVSDILRDPELGVKDHELLEVYKSQGLTLERLNEIKREVHEGRSTATAEKAAKAADITQTPIKAARKHLDEAAAAEVRSLLDDPTYSDKDILVAYHENGLTREILAGYKAAQRKKLHEEVIRFAQAEFADEEILDAFASAGLTPQKLAELKLKHPKVA